MKKNNNLPTSQEYRASHMSFDYNVNEWSEPKYICPKCGGGMCKNMFVTLTSCPPQYIYKCDKCGYREYQFG